MTLGILEKQSPPCQALTDEQSPEGEPVNSESLSSPPPSPQSTAHHKALSKDLNSIYYKKGIDREKRYGVPQNYRILTMGNYHKLGDVLL